MPGSDSLSAGWLVPSARAGRRSAGGLGGAFRPYRGGSLQFPRRTVPAFHVLYTGGFLTAAPDYSGTQVFTASVVFAPLGQARLPLVPGSRRVLVTMRQTSLDAADCRFARLPCEDIVSGHRRRDLSREPFRRRSATRRLGPYRDRTFTGKPYGTSSGHTLTPSSPAPPRCLASKPSRASRRGGVGCSDC
jgi:hypothetical protein